MNQLTSAAFDFFIYFYYQGHVIKKQNPAVWNFRVTKRSKLKLYQDIKLPPINFPLILISQLLLYTTDIFQNIKILPFRSFDYKTKKKCRTLKKERTI